MSWSSENLHRLYAAEPCCFNCSIRSLKAEISSMIANLPQGAWEKAVKPRMVLPILRSLSLLDPRRRLPLSWLHECSVFPEGRDADVVFLYWELCSMVHLGPGAFKRGFFIALHSKALAIIHLIASTHSVPHDSYWGLRERIYVLDGFDGIMTEIKDIVSRSSRGRSTNAEASAQYIWRSGGFYYALFLIAKMFPEVAHNPDVTAALDNVLHALHAVQRNEKKKILSLCMALHSKSENALIGMLGSDLLQLCVEQTRHVPSVLWEDVLSEWLRPIFFFQGARDPSPV